MCDSVQLPRVGVASEFIAAGVVAICLVLCTLSLLNLLRRVLITKDF